MMLLCPRRNFYEHLSFDHDRCFTNRLQLGRLAEETQVLEARTKPRVENFADISPPLSASSRGKTRRGVGGFLNPMS
jgi:hypothetical protein